MRELDSRLLLAGFAAERGIAVVIGAQWQLAENLAHLPPGIVLFKGNNAVQHGYMKAARGAGHAVASIEEEALGVARADQIERLYDQGVDQTCNLFFAQGEFHRQVLSNHLPAAADRVVVTGNPRMDFLRPIFLDALEERRAEIKRRHGPFILLNTNVASVNSGWGDTLAYYEICVRTRYTIESDPDSLRELREQLAWEHANTREAVRLVRWLNDNLPDRSIVIRPHPAERLETWQEAFAGQERIRVIRDGPHLPWTLASEILVHTSCTTGMEAFAAGHSAVSLCPGRSQWHDVMVSNLVNPTFETYRDAAAYLAGHFAGEHRPSEERSRFQSALAHHIAATEGRMSAELMADAFAERLSVDPTKPPPAVQPKSGYKAEGRELAWQAAKFTVGLADIQLRFAELARLLGRFRDQNVSALGHAIYQIGRGGLMAIGDAEEIELRRAARLNLQARRYELAERDLRRIVSLAPHDAGARAQLAEALRNLKRPADSAGELTRALALSPGDGELHAALARILLAMRRYDGAEHTAARAVALTPESFDLQMMHGQILATIRRYDEALKPLGKAADLAPSHSRCQVFLGECLLNLQENGKAASCLLRAAALSPGSADAHFRMGRALLRNGRHEDYAGWIDLAVALDPVYARQRGWLLETLSPQMIVAYFNE